MCPEVHFAGVVGDGSVWVCRRVVEEVSDAVLDVCEGGSADGCGDRANGRQYRGVDSPSVIEEFTQEFLDPFALGRCDRVGG